MSQSYSQRASADARPWSAHTGTNYGNIEWLTVGEWSGGDIGETFVNFDLSAFPARFKVNSATLSLWQYDHPTDDWQSPTIEVAAELADASWGELTITWANKPGSIAGLQALHNVQGEDNEHQWDVTDLIAAIGDGSQTFNGFRVRYTGTSSETAKYFRSRDYGTENVRPLLAISWDYLYGQVNVSDAWKTVELLQANVGDAWKTIESMKVNIGDAWKQIV